MNKSELMVECENCGLRFKIGIEGQEVHHKQKFEVERQSIFLTYYDCPKCGRRHYVQIDTVDTLLELQKIEGQLSRMFAARGRGKSLSKKQSEDFKEARKHLTDLRNELMKQYTGKLIHDSETDTDFEMKFSV